MKPSKFSKISILSPVSKISGIALFLLSNTVLAESYQSFSVLTYSQNSSTVNQPALIYSQNGTSDQETLPAYQSKWDSDSFALFSKYYFEEQQSLGPLNEFDYINSSSNIYASVSSNDRDSFTSGSDRDLNWQSSSNTVNIGGQWITNNFIFGAGYSYVKSENTFGSDKYDNSDSYYSAELGYLISDDFVINTYYIDGGDGDDFFSYSASYNLQLAGSDYIGFSYNVDENFDIHQLSSRYFFGFAEQSYMVVGGDYTLDNSDDFLADDSWSINASYYYDQRTSISVYYNDDDYYGLSASYYINDNYSVQASYNSNNNDKYEVDQDGYSLSFSAQF